MSNLKQAVSKICILLIICVVLSGCVGTTNPVFAQNSKITNPESGIVNWIEAMNTRDADRLYQLSPCFIKKEISREDFLKENAQNPMFLDNITFVNYSIINKTQNESFASLKAQLVMATPDPISDKIMYSPIFYTFHEFYEGSEWKVWATG